MLIGSLGIAVGGRMLLSRSDSRYSLARSSQLALRFALIHLLTGGLIGAPVLWVTGGWRGPLMACAFAVYASAMLGLYIVRESLHGGGYHIAAVTGDVVMALLLVGGAILLHAWDHFDLVASIALMTVTAIIGFLVLLGMARVRARIHPAADAPIATSALLRLSRPALLATVAQAFVIRGDRLILGIMTDTASVGLYGTAATFTEGTSLISLALSQMGFRASGQGDAQRICALRRYCLAGTLFAAAVSAALAQPLVGFLLGDAYAPAVPMIWLLLVAAALMSVFLFEAAVLNGMAQTHKPAVAAVVGCVILLVSCIALVPHFGAVAAAVASISAYGAMAGLVSRWTRGRKQARRAMH